MARAGLRPWIGLLRSRWLRWSLWAVGGPLLSLGCQTTPTAQIAPSIPPATLPVLNQSLQPASSTSSSELQQAVYHPEGPAQLPPGVEPAASPVEPPKPLPIDLDAVFRLAEDQNPKIALSRTKVHESQMQGMAGMGWMPRMTAGMAYYRHEGGIQNPNGTFVNSSTGAFYPGLDIRSELDVKDKITQRINAERNHWQQKGELSQITSDVLLEAATTYIDLLTARRAEAVSCEMEKLAAAMLKRAEDLKNNDKSATVLYESVLAEVTMRRQAMVKLRQQGDAAAAKLAYLLGLPCDVPLVPVDLAPVPISLVDVSVPTCNLVAQALATGPGVQELQGMLASIQAGQAQLESPISLLPTLQVNLFEGPFAAGPGSDMTWSNRFDAGVQARWDITALLGARQQQALAKNRLMQLHLNHQELANKLAAGVKEACTTIVLAREQMALGMSAIQHTSESHRLNELRVRENAPEARLTDVTQSIRALEQAHQEFLSALSAHNKAQIRLLLFLGPQSKGPPPPPPPH